MLFQAARVFLEINEITEFELVLQKQGFEVSQNLRIQEEWTAVHLLILVIYVVKDRGRDPLDPQQTYTSTKSQS